MGWDVARGGGNDYGLGSRGCIGVEGAGDIGSVSGYVNIWLGLFEIATVFEVVRVLQPRTRMVMDGGVYCWLVNVVGRHGG